VTVPKSTGAFGGGPTITMPPFTLGARSTRNLSSSAGVGFTGRLNVMPISDLVQVLHLCHKTGELRLEQGDRQASIFVEEGARDLGLDPPDSQANFSWIPLGDHDEAEVIQRLGERGIVVRGGTSLGGPGHIRVTYGTRGENERFLEAVEAAVS